MPIAFKDIKFGKLYEEWSGLHYRNIGKNKQTAYKTAYRRCADIEFMNVSDLRTKDFQGIIDACGGGYWVKHDIKLVCNMMMEHAMKNDYIVKNYVQYVTLPPQPKGTRDAFNENEIKGLWMDYESGQNFTGYILVMIYTGMRLGELQLIKKGDVQLDKQYITGGIKTDAGKNRRMMLPDRIMPIVMALYGERNKKLLEMDEKLFYERYYEDTLLKIAEYFKVSIDYLLTGRNFKEGREMRQIKVFNLPASAGYGSDVSGFGPQYEMRSFAVDDIPRGVTCGVKTAGDSMEPLISSGDIVFVREAAYALNGDIGIFTYYDMAYCKRLNIGKDNKITLISENPKYKPIIIEEPDLLNCLGKVIMP